jgi:SAM-dependent methyltransferase
MDGKLIDVRDIIAKYSTAEHIARADAYFADMPNVATLLRKPFFGLHDTPALLYGASEVLQRLRLFPGARVLDFGAGTGWFSKMLAYVDCKPIALDVSAHALALGRRAFERDPVAAGLSIEWKVFDGHRLPLEDESLDAIVCYDSFHHVPDQAAVLREFYRTLRPNGRIGFHEPGPHHSTSLDSQFEMRHHDVIENDIVIEDIWRTAQEIGFTGLEVALAAPRSPALSLDGYNRVISGQPTPADTAAIMRSLAEGADNLRIFVMAKGNGVDSRHGVGLSGTYAVTLTEIGEQTLRGHARVTNTGTAHWRPSLPETGGVWLGVREPSAGRAPDYGRVWLSSSGIAPGETVEVDFTLPAPAHRPAELRFDLVSELVGWFERYGATPVTIPIP